MITVQDLMSEQLFTLTLTDTVHEAREAMLNNRIRHIPIVDKDGEFVGLVTKHDILEVSVSALAEIDNDTRDELESAIPLGEIMITDITIAYADSNLLEAAKFMLEQKHGCLPVLQDSRLIGILTEADFVKLALHLMQRLDELETGKV
ncbi:CBS domain-containing protein [Candidatus Albibeggiatoa sp. nov. BB20]|uniref:CBS domain-containing protein n=1 Tax=Candidatus Albibeggiatoa sp. nov. BB20 TaxID=3162723 RepID=UPI003365B0A5